MYSSSSFPVDTSYVTVILYQNQDAGFLLTIKILLIIIYSPTLPIIPNIWYLETINLFSISI